MWNPFAARSIATRRLGQMGERRAAWFYRLRGFRILARNLRTGSGELDLIVRRGRLVVFVEVKTRQSLGAGEGVDSVDRRKQLQMVKLAGAFVANHARSLPPPDILELRYDVVSLFWTGRRFNITHFPDAFRPISDPNRPWKWTV
ncbi:MAG TPA: YraN family protein [Thermoanaerobaculia bacterium]|nr:YraN family protein [Thermoanaerobaculia bacterium]